ncbi:hypothetical protein Lesp01_25230 [Lentzea sp. NBRC 102530]|nr:hypothetical protein Lesp01_25230 [Lentzea sp. NBRC 102530]
MWPWAELILASEQEARSFWLLSSLFGTRGVRVLTPVTPVTPVVRSVVESVPFLHRGLGGQRAHVVRLEWCGAEVLGHVPFGGVATRPVRARSWAIGPQLRGKAFPAGNRLTTIGFDG